jgi:hypothetical protein
MGSKTLLRLDRIEIWNDDNLQVMEKDAVVSAIEAFEGATPFQLTSRRPAIRRGVSRWIFAFFV